MRLQGIVLRSPLVRLEVPESPAEIYLKLENLQPTGSFKLRGAGNALALIDQIHLEEGVWTASAGNMAQSLAWHARKRKVTCTVLVPDDAPTVKLDAITRLGAKVIQVPFAEYQQIQIRQHHPAMRGTLIHPFADRAVMAGNGTIALEILKELPEVEAILVPYGGGGLSCGVAAATHALYPQVKVFACEVATAAPLAASLAAGKPVEVNYTPSFVSGMGAPFVFPPMWPIASQLLHGSLVVSLPEVVAATRTLAVCHHVIAEGAGAVPLAVALTGKAGNGKVVCVVSGGNIDPKYLIQILKGHVPE
jgi:threonine dehydratase